MRPSGGQPKRGRPAGTNAHTRPVAAKPLFATTDPTRATTWESRKSVKENAFKKLLVAGDIDAASKLLENDPILKFADLTTKIQRGNSFLHAAITNSKKNSLQFVELILRHRYKLGAGIDERNAEGLSPLHVAVRTGNLDIARVLIRAGAFVNIQDKKGNTPLHSAIQQGNADAVIMLLELGASATVRNKEGFSAQGYAKRALEEKSGRTPRPRGRFGKKKFSLATPAVSDGNTNVEEEAWNIAASPRARDDCPEPEHPGPDITQEWNGDLPASTDPALDWATAEPELSPWDIAEAAAEAEQEVNVIRMQAIDADIDEEEEEDEGDSGAFDIFGDGPNQPQPLEFDPFGGASQSDESYSSSYSSDSDPDSRNLPVKERKLRRMERRQRKLALKEQDRRSRLAREAERGIRGSANSSGSSASETDSHGASMASSLTASTATRNPGLDSLVVSEDTLFVHGSSARGMEGDVPSDPQPTETVEEVHLRILRMLRIHARETGKFQKTFHDQIRSAGSRAELEAFVEAHPDETQRWINAVLPQLNESPLSVATVRSPADVIEFLIESVGADPKIANINAQSVLHLAIQRGDVRVVSILLASGASVLSRDKKGKLPLETAMYSGASWEVIAALLEATLERPASATLLGMQQTIGWCLREAVKRGSTDLVQQILASQAVDPLFSVTGAGWTPFHLAVKQGHLSLAKALLAASSNPRRLVNAQTTDGFSALHMAIEKDDVNREKMLEFLLAEGADPNAAIKSGITALHMAAKPGRVGCARLLLQAGARPDIWQERLRTPLWIAFKDSQSELCQLLVRHGATDMGGRVTYLTGEPLLYESIRRGDSDLVRAMLIDQSWQFDPCWRHPKTGVMLANLAVLKDLDDDVVEFIAKKYRDRVATRTQESAEPQTGVWSAAEPIASDLSAEKEILTQNNQNGRGPLHSAVMIDSRRKVELLGELGFDCNAEDVKGVSPMSLALLNNNIRLLELMAAKYGGKLLFAAVSRSRRQSSAQILVELGFENKSLLELFIEQQPGEAASALWFSITQGRWDTARWLLQERLTDPNTAFGSLKRTVLHDSVQRGSREAVELLLGSQNSERASVYVDVNVQDSSGWTPLHIAIQMKHKEIALALLDTPTINLGLVDSRNMSPLHLALAVPDMHEVAEKILALNQSDMGVESANDYGKTPLHYAIKRRQWKIAGAVLAAGPASIVNDVPVGTNKWSILHIAAINGYADVVARLGRSADHSVLNSQEQGGWTPLHLAVRHLHGDCVELLLRYGASLLPTHQKWNPLHTMAAACDFDTLSASDPAKAAEAMRIFEMLYTNQEFYSAASSRNSAKNTPLDVAITENNVSFAKLLLDRGVTYSRSFDFVKFTGLPVHKAVDRESVPCLKIILYAISKLPKEQQDSILAARRGSSEWPALHAAVLAQWRRADLLYELLRFGSNPLLRDANNQNVVHIAAQNSNKEALRAVLKCVPEAVATKLIKTQSRNGLTPLEVASGRPAKRILRNGFCRSYRTTMQDRFSGKPEKDATRRRKVNERFQTRANIRADLQDCLKHGFYG